MLPEPSFIDRDPQIITAEMVAQYEAMTGKTLYPAQPERVLIDLIAYRETLLRIGIQEAAKLNLVAYAMGIMLDHLGALLGVSRLQPRPAQCTMMVTLEAVAATSTIITKGATAWNSDKTVAFALDADLIIPGGQLTGNGTASCTTAGNIGNGFDMGAIATLITPIDGIAEISNSTLTMGGAEEEDDDHLRERIILAPEAFSVAGSRLAYRFWAMSAHQSIVDVAVISPVPGEVCLYPLVVTGTPDQAVLDAVEVTCSADTVRPLTDQVSAVAPVKYEFAVNADIILYATADRLLTIAQIEQALLSDTVKARRTLGRDITRPRLVACINGVAGVYSCTLHQPAADIVCADNEWADCSGFNLIVTGVING